MRIHAHCENVHMRAQIIFNSLAAHTLLRNSIPPGTHGKHKWHTEALIGQSVSAVSYQKPRHLESNDYPPSLHKKNVIVLPRVGAHLIL